MKLNNRNNNTAAYDKINYSKSNYKQDKDEN